LPDPSVITVATDENPWVFHGRAYRVTGTCALLGAASVPLSVTESPTLIGSAEALSVKPGFWFCETAIENESDSPRRLRRSPRNTTRSVRSPGMRKRWTIV
jgi:hypothetical protein